MPHKRERESIPYEPTQEEIQSAMTEATSVIQNYLGITPTTIEGVRLRHIIVDVLRQHHHEEPLWTKSKTDESESFFTTDEEIVGRFSFECYGVYPNDIKKIVGYDKEKIKEYFGRKQEELHHFNPKT